MCRLTLVWILANFYKATGMQTHLPSLWLDPHVMLTRLSATVSGVDCPCPCPVANPLLPAPFSTNSLLASPSTSGHGEISSPKPFVWFRAKTDKGIVCLAGHLHHHHHHHLVLVALIFLTLSRNCSLSFIALGRSSGQHPVSSHSC